MNIKAAVTADLMCKEQSMKVGRVRRSLLMVAWAGLLIGPSSPVAAQDSFTLSPIAATCERTPTAFPFQGGDCVPAEGAVIVVTTDTGELVGTCIAVPEEAGSLIASCSVDVPFGTVVLVTEDVATITAGYAPELNPQRFEVPTEPPDGPFGGPVFLNLPLTEDGTPNAVVSTPTNTPASPSSACDADPLPSPTPDASLALPGYGVVFDGDSAFFIAWTERDGTLTGTLRLTYADAEAGGYVSEERTFTGYRSDDQLTLAFDDGFDSQTVSGTLDGDELTLYWTDGDGTTFPLFLEFGTLAQYDQGVVTLRQQADQTAECLVEYESTATAVAEEQNAVAQANQQLGWALQDLSDDVSFLAENTDFESELESYESDWDVMKADERALRRSAAEATLACFELEGVDYELEVLAYDQEVVDYDREVLEYVVEIIASSVVEVEADIIALQDAFADLEAAVEANSTGTPSAAYSNSDVEQAVTDAETQIEDSEDAVAESITRADEIDRAADRLYDDAETFVAALTCSD